MKKIVKVLESDMKKFNSYVGNFNRILRKNGMADLRIIKESAQFKVRYTPAYYDPYCRGIKLDTLHSYDVWANGFNVEMDIPEEILKVGSHKFIGSMVKVDGIWQKHFVSNDCEYNDFICEENFRCDHCHAEISSRTGYLFYVDDNGNKTVVGRKCARSYFGYNVEEIVNAISNFDVIEYEDDCEVHSFERFDRYSASFDIRWFIPIVAYYTDDFTRWHKKEEDFDMNAGIPVMGGTSENVKKIYDVITDPKPSREDIENLPDVGIYVKKYVSDNTIEKIKKFWENENGNSDFAYNCKQIIEKGHASRRWIGYMAWAIFASMKQEVEKKDDQKDIGEFVGELNERKIFTLTITNIAEVYQERYGYNDDRLCLKIKFDDENKNHFQTNCYSYKMMPFFRENEGKQVRIKATIVSRFERKNGQKVNFITRAVIAK